MKSIGECGGKWKWLDFNIAIEIPKHIQSTSTVVIGELMRSLHEMQLECKYKSDKIIKW